MNSEETTTQSVPWRFREAQFRRYEEPLAQAVFWYPRTFTLDPLRFNLPPSTLTVVARLRDARISLLKYNWPTKVDIAKLRNACEDMVFSEGEKVVFTGTTEGVKLEKNPLSPKTPRPGFVPKGTHELKVSRDQFFFLCQLANSRLLSRPLLLTSIPNDQSFALAQSHIDQAEESWDVGFVKQEDEKSWVLLCD